MLLYPIQNLLGQQVFVPQAAALQSQYFPDAFIEAGEIGCRKLALPVADAVFVDCENLVADGDTHRADGGYAERDGRGSAAITGERHDDNGAAGLVEDGDRQYDAGAAL